MLSCVDSITLAIISCSDTPPPILEFIHPNHFKIQENVLNETHKYLYYLGAG
jgi:hypothetical protein